MNIEPITTIRPVWTGAQPLGRATRIVPSRLASAAIEKEPVPQINRGWLKSKPSSSEQRFESDEAIIARARVEAIVVDIFIAAALPTRPVIVLGAHKVDEFQYLINQTHTQAQARRIIDLLNEQNSDGQPLTAFQFAARVALVVQIHNEIKKQIQAPKHEPRPEAVPYKPSASMNTFIRKYELQVSALKLKISRSLGLADSKLRGELKQIEEKAAEKAATTREESKKEASKKLVKQRRGNWEDMLKAAGIIAVPRPYGRAPVSSSLQLVSR